MEINELIKSIRLHIARGEFEQARAKLLSGEKVEQNPEAMALGAKLAGYEQGVEKAIAMFLDLEAAWPKNFDIYYIHNQFLQENSEFNAAIDLGELMTKRFPENPLAWRMLMDANELAGKVDAAAKVAAIAIVNFPQILEFSQAFERFQLVLTRLDISDESIQEVRDEMACQTMSFQEDSINILLGLFKGRENVHAIQAKMGQSWGYLPEKRELTFADMKDHCKGKKTLGLYLVSEDNDSRLMVLDLDVKKDWLGSFNNIANERKRIKSLIRCAAKEIVELCSSIGLTPLIEHSGNKGLHFWFFSDEPFPCRYWRTLGNWLVEKIQSKTQELAWEVFPKQDRVKEGGLGNLVKIPLGIHQKTGKRSFFIDLENFKPYQDQIAAVASFPKLNKALLEKVLGAITISSCHESSLVPVRPDIINAQAEQANYESLPESETKFELKVSIPLPERQTVEIEQLLTGCKPLWAIVEKVRMGEILNGAERHAFVYIFAHLGEEGKVFIHQVLNQLPEYSPDAVNAMIRAVPPNPSGCNKIRKKIPHICNKFDCNCQFRLPAGCYASPVVHAGIFPGTGNYTEISRSPDQPASLAVHENIGGASGSIDRLMHEYQKLQTEMCQMTDRMKLLKRQINKVFEESGKETIATRIRVYHRLPDSGDDLLEVQADDNVGG